MGRSRYRTTRLVVLLLGCISLTTMWQYIHRDAALLRDEKEYILLENE